MITIRVKMLGTFKGTSGRGEVELTLPEDVDVAGVIGSLAEESLGGLAEALLDPDLRGQPPNALILLNGVEIGNLDGLGTAVADGDRLDLLPVAHGG